MTKQQIIKALESVPDDAEVKVDVVIYNEVCQDHVMQKRFDIMSLDVWAGVPVVLVQCADTDEWIEMDD